MDENSRHFLVDYCSCTTKNGQYNFVIYFMDGLFYLEQSLQRPPAMPILKVIDFNKSIAVIRKQFIEKINSFKNSDGFISFKPRYSWVQSFPWIEHTRSCEVMVTYHFEDYEIECDNHKLTFMFDQWGYCYGVDVDQHYFIDFEVFQQWLDAGKYYFENYVRPDIFRETWIDVIYQSIKYIQYRSNCNDLMRHTRAYGRNDIPTYSFAMTNQYNHLFELLMELVIDQKVNANIQQAYLAINWTMTRQEVMERSRQLKLEKQNQEAEKKQKKLKKE